MPHPPQQMNTVNVLRKAAPSLSTTLAYRHFGQKCNGTPPHTLLAQVLEMTAKPEATRDLAMSAHVFSEHGQTTKWAAVHMRHLRKESVRHVQNCGR
jgi:hypothetical protein